MRYHFGAAHSCSSFADLVIKNSHTTEYTRPVATGGIVKTIFPHNFPKNDAQDLKKWSRKTRPVFLYNLR